MVKPKRSREHKRDRSVSTNARESCCDAWRREAAQFLAQGKVIPALEVLNSIIEIGQASIADWLLAGKTLMSIREFAQAVVVLEQGLKLDAEHEACRFNLAAALFQLGDVSSAVNHFQWVAERHGNLNAWQNLATIIPGCPQSDHQRVLDTRKNYATKLAAATGTYLDLGFLKREAGQRLRVGYISAFFHRPNYMKPVWGLINGHDRQRFEICLFADEIDEGGLDWFQSGPHDRLHLTRELDNPQLISLIREQQLDIVVDLNGYSVPARLEILISRLAPVTVAWFNMYATSGLPGVDWIVGDEFVIRADEEQYYSEAVRRLPQSYLSFLVGHQAPEIALPPCLGGQSITFGSLVSQYKITPPVLDAWSEILKESPESRLVLANRTVGAECNRNYVIDRFHERGIGSGRIRFLPPAPHFEFLKYYDRIDIALDSFPYNGGTTTTEAIWQGVPVLAIDGDRWASRTSKTLLMNCHLSEFVAADEQDYIAKAVSWATDSNSPRRLAELRKTMRTCLAASPVCQTRNMVEAMEQFFFSLVNKTS